MLRPPCGRNRLVYFAIAITLGTMVGTGSAWAQSPPDTFFVSVDPMVPGGAPGNDVTGVGSRSAPFRQITKAVSLVMANNKHVIVAGPTRGNVYAGTIYTPYNWALKIVSEKGPDSTYLGNASGDGAVNLNADTVLQILEGFTIADNVVGGCEGVCVGGVAAYGRAWVINNKILRNVGNGGGGGINYYGSLGYGGIIAGNWIANNHDVGGVAAGGIEVIYAWSLSIINNTIIGNTAQDGAGIQIGSDAQDVTIANNIIAYNQTGFGIFNAASSGVAANNLFYLNEAGDALQAPVLIPCWPGSVYSITIRRASPPDGTLVPTASCRRNSPAPTLLNSISMARRRREWPLPPSISAATSSGTRTSTPISPRPLRRGAIR
ncbi:MAG: hypothetical protein HZB43_11525 [candidate division Zixibacteria bacterium]|nr:hypothetical protein [candidate division Zixibacteria bacterium]